MSFSGCSNIPGFKNGMECYLREVCRVKTYLRNTLGQERLNNLMILHAHKEITDSLDLDAIANEFIVNSEHR